jgi:3-oxoadipate enol-lactonase
MAADRVTRIRGPLHAEFLGPEGAPPMLFVHPNPLDSACWLYQMAHFSTWYRCIAVDLPGYGRSPTAAEGLDMAEIADACWDVVDRAGAAGPAVLVGCSVGSYTVQHMFHRRPEATRAVVLAGAAWRPTKQFASRRIASYREHGIDFRREYTLEVLSPEFRQSPLARWLASLLTERNDSADLDTIVEMFQAVGHPDPEWLQRDLDAPVLILTGTEDHSHEAAYALRDRLPDVELVAIEGAGHACFFEQPWTFDAEMIRFLRDHGHAQLPAPEGRLP